MAGYFRINRIRLEFKDFLHRQELLFHVVLIESDWNLKYPQKRMTRIQNSRINRIRLEFKADGQSDRKSTGHSINRIRLEFKDAFAVIFYNDDFVLIESDWNLKSLQHSVL